MAKRKGYTESMERLVGEFERLPGIGRKTAERLAYHVLVSPRDEMLGLAAAIREVKETVKSCAVCHNIADASPCEICSDPTRDQGVICIVEQPKDLLALEASAGYNGVYHVLGGHIAPLEGVDPEDLTIDALVERVGSADRRITEVILATNPNLEGDSTALHIQERLKQMNVRITRLARGLPSGGFIEHANPVMLSDALEGRAEM